MEMAKKMKYHGCKWMYILLYRRLVPKNDHLIVEIHESSVYFYTWVANRCTSSKICFE